MRNPWSYLRAAPDLVRAWSIEPDVEQGRLREGPLPLVARLRQQGATRQVRDQAGRARLRAAIALVERLRGRKPNCYRRVLLELALDAGAARERVFLALDSRGGPASGHAYLESQGDGQEKSYDALFTM